jgi:hypothetical protein
LSIAASTCGWARTGARGARERDPFGEPVAEVAVDVDADGWVPAAQITGALGPYLT